MFHLRDRELSLAVVRELQREGQRLRIMHVCGTHQDTVVRFGLDALLREAGVSIVQGPGCPVCVTTSGEIEMAVALAREGVIVATYGDMVRVPGISGSLASVQTRGGDVRVVYDVHEAVALARGGRETVFVAAGFETTAPATAAALLRDPPETFSVLSCHRLIPPALEAILSLGEVALDGIIDPGHVSVIIGVEPYRSLSRSFGIPQVIAGFEPLDVLMAVHMLARQVREGRCEVENEYSRAVDPEGNTRAQDILHQVFTPVDAPWRGFSTIPRSKLALRPAFARYDAERRYPEVLDPVREQEDVQPPGCRCGEVLRGLLPPRDCALFGKACTPEHPVGPCMVSREGSCHIEYRYGHD